MGNANGHNFGHSVDNEDFLLYEDCKRFCSHRVRILAINKRSIELYDSIVVGYGEYCDILLLPPILPSEYKYHFQQITKHQLKICVDENLHIYHVHDPRLGLLDMTEYWNENGDDTM